MVNSGRQRVQAALALDVADRPPFSAWGHLYDREWDAASLADATVETARLHQLDFVKLQVRATCFAEAFGGRWRASGSAERDPVLEAPGGTTAEDWRRIAAGEERLPGPLAEQVEVVRRVAAALGPDVPVLQTVFSPGMVAWFLTGRDTALLARFVRDEPALAAAVLERIAGVLADFAADSIAAGAAGLFYAINPLADTTVVGASEYEATYLAADRAALAGAEAGWFTMLHLCAGHVNGGLVAKLPVHCVNWSTHEAGSPSLTAMRDRYRRAVAGGLQRYAPIECADSEELRAAAAAALAATGRTGHLLTPGCSTSPWSRVRPANLAAMAAAAAGDERTGVTGETEAAGRADAAAG